jgi:hypothetical protein
MSRPRAPNAYSREDQDRLRTELDKMDAKSRKAGQDVEVAGSERLILSSPNGSRWDIQVSNAGALSAVAL